MTAIGIDISKGRSTVAVVGRDKILLHKPFDILHNKEGFEKLIDFIKKYDDVCVVMEHTGAYYRIVAETLHKAGIRVSVVNPVLINKYGDNSLRKVKTDKKDSVKIGNYAQDNRLSLRDYTSADTLRDDLKSIVRQFNYESKILTSHKNKLNATLERVFPNADNFFRANTKPDGHQKFIDFIIEFWHNDCVSSLSETKFFKKYKNFCKKSGYIFKEENAQKIYKTACGNITTMPDNETAKLLVYGLANRVLYLSAEVEKLRAEMIKLAKQLPEFETVLGLYGVGESIAAQLIGEIGDVRRFKSKRSIVSFAGVDAEKNDSGKKISKSGQMTRKGNAILRKLAYQVAEVYLLNSPVDEPVYQFLNKKRSEGKHYFVYMVAACNKFLRVYYTVVKEFLDSLETDTATTDDNAPEVATVKENVETTVTTEKTLTKVSLTDMSINPYASANNNNTFTCEEDSATQECDTSVSQGFAKQIQTVKTSSS